MGFVEDFKNDDGWSIIDTNIRLHQPKAKGFVQFLKDENVSTVIRYYANRRNGKLLGNPKTLTPDEAQFLSENGFGIVTIFQQNNRLNKDFKGDNGRRNADTALEFADLIGQPEKSLLLFAVDSDFTKTASTSDNSKRLSFVVDYFEQVNERIDGRFRLGAYGSGLVLRTLLDEGLIEFPWLSMSRLFSGTKDFFLDDAWFLRQLPLPQFHPFGDEPKPHKVRNSKDGDSGVFFDKNTLNISLSELGTFRIEDGKGILMGDEIDMDGTATLGGSIAGVAKADGKFDAMDAIASANAFVKTEGLNFRTESNGTIIRSLTIGTPVNNLGAHPADPKWNAVEIDGRKGAVFGKFLRQPVAPEVEALLATTIAQWVRFDKGMGREDRDPFFKFVGEMFDAVPGFVGIDGKDRHVPWSAAFISFVVKNAGPEYANFKFSAAHSQFVNDAIHARNAEDRSKPFWGFRVTEKKPEIGDIIQRNRGGTNFSFDFAENHASFKSHSDVVVEVTPEIVRVIGGNVGHTVSMVDNIQEYDLDDRGFLPRVQADGQRLIALLKNRAAEVDLG